MLTEILLFIFNTLASLLTMVLLLRFLMQWWRIPFANPLGDLVFALTNWLVLPLRRIVRGMKGLDFSSVLAAWLIQLGYILLVSAIMRPEMFQVAGFWGAAVILSLVGLAEAVLYLMIGIVLISAVISWINPYAPMASIFFALSRPLLRPLQRVLPPVGRIDLSPLVAMMLLYIGLIIIRRLAAQLVML